MVRLNQPLLFEPYLRPMVWGGRELTVLNKRMPDAASYGESWEISDHPHHRSVIAQGPLAGTSVRSLMEQHRQELLGPAAERYAVFPWLVKWLDARDWLSVQVHPDDAKAKVLWPGEGGKTEAWVIVAAKEGARVWAGLKEGVDAQCFLASLHQGTILECLNEITPRPGQCIFLPAGTVHAVGGGVLFAEVQQTSDATFRLFDWNRVDAEGKPRKLHLEQGMAAIDWNAGPVKPVHIEGFPAFNERRSGPLPNRNKQLVRCEFFSLSCIQGTEPIQLGNQGRLQVAIVLAGSGRLANGVEVQTGQTWLLPASLPDIALQPGDQGISLLVSTL